MIQKIGGRKSVWYLMSLATFLIALWMLKPKDGNIESSVVFALGSVITMMLSAAVYGNVKTTAINGDGK